MKKKNRKEFLLDKNRKQKFLSFLKKKNQKRVYLVFDSETKLEKITKTKTIHEFYLVCAKIISLDSNGNYDLLDEFHSFDLTHFHTFLSEQIKKYPKLYLIAHNTSYDIISCNLFNFFHNSGFEIKVWNIRKGSFFVSLKNKTKKIIIMDNLNLFKTSLDELGKILNYKKTEMPKNYDNEKLWVAYCMNDVDVVIEGLRKLSNMMLKFNIGELRETKGALAFSIFRKYFMPLSLLIHNNLNPLQLEYDSFFGGRTECFKTGLQKKRNYFMYDFNSLYPSIMYEKKIGYRYKAYFVNPTLKQLKYFLRKFSVCARVKIKTDIPIFPKRSKSSIYFPIGTFETFLASGELEEAVKRNMILKIYECSVYRKKIIFRDFISHFHSMKQKYSDENNEVFRYFTKIIMNSLYGKFSQKRSKLKKVGYDKKNDYAIEYHTNISTGKKYTIKTINHEKFVETNNIVANNSIPIISADVTSYARMKLFRAMEKIGIDKVYYCDTDSIITTLSTLEMSKLGFSSKGLGALEFEKKSQHLKINVEKDYEFGKYKKLKGIPKKSKETSENVFEFEKFGNIIEIMRDAKNSSMFSETTKKVVTRKYWKRMITKDGETVPWRLEEK